MPGYSLRRGTLAVGDTTLHNPADLAARLFEDLGGTTGTLTLDGARCELVERDGATVGVVVWPHPSVRYELEFGRAVGFSRVEHLKALDQFLDAVVQNG